MIAIGALSPRRLPVLITVVYPPLRSAYLGPISDGGITSLLMNSNLFFHFLIPIISILNFILFEKTDKEQSEIMLYT